MPNYDFQTLSPYDFEIITRDLVQARDKIVLESFRTGRDQGIDFRYSPSAGNATIVQCKHYHGTGFDGLVRSLKREAPKVDKLKPSRYIVSTSVSLTPSNKCEISAIFGISLLKNSDIIGRDDLNNLLGLHPLIEKAHYKLWLASVEVLQTVLFNAERTRTEFELRRIHNNLKRYVQNETYPRALTILEENRILIISGQPGVGKTTLSDLLIYAHVEKNYAPIIINGNIEEARRQFISSEPQIFYYDDFLGATFLGEHNDFLSENHDRDLLKFIDMVKASKNARLVMTTREHILRQALSISERFSYSGVVDHKCVLDVKDYTKIQRAKILYNHIYFSNLPIAYIHALLEGDFYKKIIDHTKFNPRLVEWLSSFQRIKAVPVGQYQAFALNLLNDPAQIWRHAYFSQISDSARSLLLTLHSLGTTSLINVSVEAFSALNSARSKKYNFQITPEDGRRAIEEVCDSFVASNGTILSYINPSVGDLMNYVITSSPSNGIDIILSARRFRQIKTVIDLAQTEAESALAEDIASNIDEIASVAEALLDGPVFIRKNNEYRWVDIDHDKRLITMIDLCNMTKSRKIFSLVEHLLSTVIKKLEDGSISTRDAIEIENALIESDWVKSQFPGAPQKLVRQAMLRSLSETPSSDDIFALFQHIDKPLSEWEEQERTLFVEAKEIYFDQILSQELSSCENSNQCSDLAATVEAIGEFFEEDVRAELEEISEKGGEFEGQEEARAESLRDEWRGSSSHSPHNGSEIDDMFGTLLGND